MMAEQEKFRDFAKKAAADSIVVQGLLAELEASERRVKELEKKEFNHDELLWIWYALMLIDRSIFDSAPYSLKELEKLQDKLDCMVEQKS